MAKKYYWLKLNENFFEKDEIKVIEGMVNGEKYINFYLKLLLKSIKGEGKLMFRNIIPYTNEILSSVTNTDIDTVRVSIDVFKSLGLMEKLDDGSLFMIEMENMIGSETIWAERKRVQREKQKGIKNCEKEFVQTLSTDCPKDIDKEKKIDREKDIIDSKVIKDVIEAWNKLKLSRVIAIKNKRYDLLKNIIDEYGISNVIKSIEVVNKSSFLKGNNEKKWVIKFDWLINPDNFIKVLEGNYTDKELYKVKKCGEYNKIYDFIGKENRTNDQKKSNRFREELNF